MLRGNLYYLSLLAWRHLRLCSPQRGFWQSPRVLRLTSDRAAPLILSGSVWQLLVAAWWKSSTTNSWMWHQLREALHHRNGVWYKICVVRENDTSKMCPRWLISKSEYEILKLNNNTERYSEVPCLTVLCRVSGWVGGWGVSGCWHHTSMQTCCSDRRPWLTHTNPMLDLVAPSPLPAVSAPDAFPCGGSCCRSCRHPLSQA